MRTIPPVFRQSQVAAALALALSPAASLAATITVNSTAASGAGTLHDAILQANSNCLSDPNPVIAFAFAGTGPFVIQPSSPLPQFACGAGGPLSPTVDGYTQPGSSTNESVAGWDAVVKVVIDGGGGASAGCGLAQYSFGYGGFLTVRGLRVQNFSYGGGTGVGLCGRLAAEGNEIVNNNYGIYLNDYGFSVGGSSAAARNVIVSNDVGVYSTGGGSNIENNFIGTKDGSTAAGNDKGIYVGGGGGAWVFGNVISGNTGVGVDVYGDYGGVTIEDNTIGLNVARTAKLANAGGGILIREAQNALISGNFISGNSVGGITVQNSSFIEIEDNTIGLNYGGGAIANTRGIDASCGSDFSISGNTVAGNQIEGLLLSGISVSDISNNTIADNNGTGLRIDNGSCYGGINFVYGNLITGNNVDGILLSGGTVRNLITGNSVFANSRKNINLNGSTLQLPNDTTDADGGNNDQQNYPVVDSVTQSAGNTDIFFTLTTADGTYNVELFSNDTAGGPAGQTYLGSQSVTVYGGVGTGGFTAYSFLADHVSATATTGLGNTSEFSLQKAATTAPAVTLSPASLIFGNQRVGTSSMDRIVLVRSVGDQPYVIGSFCYGGPDAISGKLTVSPISALCTGGGFTCESTCVPGQPYNKNQTCQIKASFSPTFTGPFSEDLFLCDNSPTGVTTLNLSGTGVPPPPLQISPTFYDFGGIPVGATSDTARFEVKNVSYGMLSMLGVVTTGEYDLVSTTCTGILYGGGICEAIVSFGPTISGESFGTVMAAAGLVGDAKGAVSPFTTYQATADLVGVGLAGGEMTLPGPIELGAAPVGGPAITKNVELRNTGTQPVNVASITVSAPFTIVSNTCVGTPIPPGGGCAVVISYAATAPGSVTGSLTIVSDATGGSGEVSVHATGQTSAAPLVVATPTSIGFGDRTIGTQTNGRTVSLTNIGGVTANLSLAVSSIDFILGGTSCGATLAPQASCTAEVAFRPILGFGPRTGALVISSNSSNSPLSVILGGTSCRPFIGLGSRTGTSSNCAP